MRPVKKVSNKWGSSMQMVEILSVEEIHIKLDVPIIFAKPTGCLPIVFTLRQSILANKKIYAIRILKETNSHLNIIACTKIVQEKWAQWRYEQASKLYSECLGAVNG